MLQTVTVTAEKRRRRVPIAPLVGITVGAAAGLAYYWLLTSDTG